LIITALDETLDVTSKLADEATPRFEFEVMIVA
jgi:hypothetical protein